MSDEKDKNRIEIEDLSQPNQTLTSEEAKKVQGGADMTTGDVSSATGGAGAGKIKFNEFTIKKVSDSV